jgi:hypothetical protein
MQHAHAGGDGGTVDTEKPVPTEASYIGLEHGEFVTALAENVLLCAVLWLGLTTACELLIQESDYTPAIRWALMVQPASLALTAVLICLAYGSASPPDPLLSQISQAYCTHTLCVLVVYISIYLQAMFGGLDDTRVNSQHGDPLAIYSFSVREVWIGYALGAGSAVVQDPEADEGSVVWVQQHTPLLMSVVLFGIMCAYLGLMWILSCYLVLTVSSSKANVYRPFPAFWYVTQFCACNILVSLGLPLLVDYLYMDCAKLGYEILLVVYACIVTACWQQGPLSVLWNWSSSTGTGAGMAVCIAIVLVPTLLQRWVLMYIGIALSGMCVCVYVMAWLHEAAHEATPPPRAHASMSGHKTAVDDQHKMTRQRADDQQKMMDRSADDQRVVEQNTDDPRVMEQNTDDQQRMIEQNTDDQQQMIDQSANDPQGMDPAMYDQRPLHPHYVLQSPPSHQAQHIPSTAEMVRRDARRRGHVRHASIGGAGHHAKHEGQFERDYAQDMHWSFPHAGTRGSVFAGYKKA